MRVCEWFYIFSRKLTSRSTGTLEASQLSCKGCLRLVSLVVTQILSV